jgi:hypothetical protein
MSDTVQKLLEGSRRFIQASRRFIQKNYLIKQLVTVSSGRARASSTSWRAHRWSDTVQKLLEGSGRFFQASRRFIQLTDQAARHGVKRESARVKHELESTQVTM